jgi:hypothetical protein
MSSSSAGPLRFSYEETVVHVRRMLGGFAPGYGDAQLSDQAYKIPVPSSKLAVPVLAREVMVVFGAEYRGRWDKVAWRYGFSVDGVPCMLESARSGLWLHIDAAVGDDDAAEQLAQRVIEKLAAAQKVVNKSVLQPQLDSQIQAGNVTIINQYTMLRWSYEYFREAAEQAYAGAGRVDHSGSLVDLIAGRGSMEGWWNTLAMVSGYFSTLEHILIGCLPFTSFDPATEDLVSVIGDPLKEKMKRVMNISNDPVAMRQFDALRDIVDRFRNTYSHGAFGHGGKAAMFVHVPDVGGVPVTLGEFGVRPELLFVPAVKDDFDRICSVFDSCDGWLANGPLADGHRWVLEGLDFRFDADFRTAAAAARDQGRFDAFLRAASIRADAVRNWEI